MVIPQPASCAHVEQLFARFLRLVIAMQIETSLTSAELQDDLRLLYAERTLAQLAGLASDPRYMDDLLDDIAAHESALTGVVVTEIATLRGELSGPLWG
jgi:hypothetical protein